ncbi:DUF3810 domain-containing protein [Flavobacterium sp. 3HN19-14]|uniref:DUF3810 domain-containing protein n=1 Tax=Flavobacterium sp. 3HN19-14 TaxID=3448133 RepID=UPI003EE3E62E
MKKKFILPVFLLVQIIALQILKFFPEAVENCYSNGLYIWVSNFMRALFGWITFSFGDVLYFLLGFFIVWWFFKVRKTWRYLWKDNLLKILSFLSVAYFAFHLLWAANYYRVPLYQKMKIKKEYSVEDLSAFTKKLIVKVNAIQFKITKSDTEKIVFPYSRQQVYEKNLNGYKNLAAVYPYFTYTNPSVKNSIISLPLTYMGFAGYLNPFTGEAQVNDMIPMYNFPVTVTHEMAHQMGYASESEANFIGFLACTKNDDLYFQYAAYSFALKYCLNTLERIEECKSDEFIPLINVGVLQNYKESRQFWKQYQSFVDDGFEVVYDSFLKANQQKEGMDSYSKFVDLMVNYYKLEKL